MPSINAFSPQICETSENIQTCNQKEVVEESASRLLRLMLLVTRLLHPLDERYSPIRTNEMITLLLNSAGLVRVDAKQRRCIVLEVALEKARAVGHCQLNVTQMSNRS